MPSNSRGPRYRASARVLQFHRSPPYIVQRCTQSHTWSIFYYDLHRSVAVVSFSRTSAASGTQQVCRSYNYLGFKTSSGQKAEIIDKWSEI